MSNKIDIDEELTEKDKKETKPAPNKKLALAVIAAILVIAAGIAAFFILNNTRYVKTDNAKVAVDLYKIQADKDGKLVKFDVYENKYVQSGDVLGRIDGGTYIKAPSNGEFIEIDAYKGDYVTAGETLAILGDTDDIYININIEESDIRKIKAGQKAIVSLDACPGKKFKGVVTEVDNMTSNALSGNMTSYSTSGTYTKTTQLIPVKVKLTDPEVYLGDIIGTNATVKIKVR
ncbi:MAG: efflux RND transporter periplasmic adaptor subunit [Oscillospiraceae bacterium]|nr:efflux RND transporter periplasmic adaptor subunit [Oscillospiraceae bacterium]